jgi:hypothetical protein
VRESRREGWRGDTSIACFAWPDAPALCLRDAIFGSKHQKKFQRCEDALKRARHARQHAVSSVSARATKRMYSAKRGTALLLSSSFNTLILQHNFYCDVPAADVNATRARRLKPKARKPLREPLAVLP